MTQNIIITVGQRSCCYTTSCHVTSRPRQNRKCYPHSEEGTIRPQIHPEPVGSALRKNVEITVGPVVTAVVAVTDVTERNIAIIVAEVETMATTDKGVATVDMTDEMTGTVVMTVWVQAVLTVL